MSEEKDIPFLHGWLLAIFREFTSGFDVVLKPDQQISEYDEILVYYINDLGVPACFSIEYFVSDEDDTYDLLSISPFNHPAGELLMQRGKDLCDLLFNQYVECVIFTDNSPLYTPEIFEKFYTANELPKETIYFLNTY